MALMVELGVTDILTADRHLHSRRSRTARASVINPRKKSCVMGLSPITIAYFKGIAAIFSIPTLCARIYPSQCRVQYGFSIPIFNLWLRRAHLRIA